MIIIFQEKATDENVKNVVDLIESKNLSTSISKGHQVSVVDVLGDVSVLDTEALRIMPGVEQVIRVTKPYKLASLSYKDTPDVINLGKGVLLGGEYFVNFAGPYAIESQEQLYETAKGVKAAGAKVLRGGVYNPATKSPSALTSGLESLKWLREIADELDMLVISEVISEYDIEEMVPFVDLFQIGTRNAQNFRLLKSVGQTDKPILLKRGMAETIDELLSSTEYILSEGNDRVILCERGIRTFENSYRSTLDLSCIPVLQQRTHLPVVVDPSYAAGNYQYVPALALGAVAAGAHGIMIDVHCNPADSLTDSPQQLTIDQYADLTRKIEQILPVVEKKNLHL